MQLSLIVDTFEKMEQTSSRLLLTDLLVNLFKQTPSSVINKVIYLIQGKIYPDYEGVELGLAEKMAIKAISLASGHNTSTIIKSYARTGDLGDTAREVMKDKSQTTLFSEAMTVERVHLTLERIAKTSGAGSQEIKLKMVSNLLHDSTPDESRYIMKFLMGSLRLGIADYTLMDALALAFTGKKDTRSLLEKAYNVSSDLGTVASLLAESGIEAVDSLKITLFKPVRPMLAERARTSGEAIERMSGNASVEYKLDGERLQVHKCKTRIELFSRRLEKITNHYPDIVEAIKDFKATDIILEGEVVAINAANDEYLPFQELMHRRRKHNIPKAMQEYPVIINFFDILYYKGKDITGWTYEKRRNLLEKLVTDKDALIRLVPKKDVSDAAQIDKIMALAVESGCEGVMLKQPSSNYRAGARGYAWIKLKREYQSDIADTLDLVIVGALYGRGRRVGKYGALLLASYDRVSDTFKSVTKVGAGFTDVHLAQFYKELEKLVIDKRHPRVDAEMQMDVWFTPKIVIEVSASEVTLSPLHSAAKDLLRKEYGLALRFPKFTGNIRIDKNPEDSTEVSEIVKMYKMQLKTIKDTGNQKLQDGPLIMKIFTLSKSETADLITKIKEIWPADTVQKVKVLKIIEIEDGKRIIKSDDESLIAVQKDNSIVPFINSSNIDRFASVHVDMGAVKFICNGAKIMRPGITKYDSFNKGDVVVVRDTNHLKVLASGLALVSSSELTEMTKGFVIDNIHYISDRFWETYKEI